MRVAIIPARGGSKRIPRKNIREFHGQPIMVYPIYAALASKLFDRIIVSSDDAQIRIVARQCGVEALERPPELADDYTGTQAVVRHALEQLVDKPAQACCIYPTAALLNAGDLVNGFTLLTSRRCCYAFSVVRYDFPVEWALRLDPDGKVKAPPAGSYARRTQDLEHAWHDAGYFYWGEAQAFLDNVPLYGPWSVGFELPRHRWQDINTEEDWKMAELLYEAAMPASRPILTEVLGI